MLGNLNSLNRGCSFVGIPLEVRQSSAGIVRADDSNLAQDQAQVPTNNTHIDDDEDLVDGPKREERSEILENKRTHLQNIIIS